MVSRDLLGIGESFILMQFDSDVLFLLDSIGILLTESLMHAVVP